MKITLNLTKNKQFQRKISNAMDELFKINAVYPKNEYKLVMSGAIDLLFAAKLADFDTIRGYYERLMRMDVDNVTELRCPSCKEVEETTERKRNRVWDSIKKEIIIEIIKVLDKDFTDYYESTVELKLHRLFQSNDIDHAKKILEPILAEALIMVVEWDKYNFGECTTYYDDYIILLNKLYYVMFDEIMQELIRKYNLHDVKGCKIINNTLINDLKEMLK